MALPKWTDERTAALTNFVGDESPVSQATVAEAADQLETSTRSISSKLRKMGYDVELASAAGDVRSAILKKLLSVLSLLTTLVSTLMLKSLSTLKAVSSHLSQSKERSFLWS